MMKVLNLYCGIGGNRKLWENCEVTSVDNNSDICRVYSDLYPKDEVVVGCAHSFLKDNYMDFDFIWTSPPCTSHSQFRQNLNVNRGKSEPLYVDMSLYQEILFLKHNFKGKWVAENVKPYYTPLIPPSFEMERHFFWCNFEVSSYEPPKTDLNIIKRGTVKDLQEKHGIYISEYDIKNKRQILRNCVNPLVGNHIYKSSMKKELDIEALPMFTHERKNENHAYSDCSIICASGNGHTETVKVLLGHGANREVLK